MLAFSIRATKPMITVVFAFALLLSLSRSMAQTPNDLYLPWHPDWNVPQLGQGIEVNPNALTSPVSTRNSPVGGYKPAKIAQPNWQVATLDYTSDEQSSKYWDFSTMGSAYALIGGWLGVGGGASGSLSIFNYDRAFTRVWAVVAEYKTNVFADGFQMTSEAKKRCTDPTTGVWLPNKFRDFYGNYFVSGVTYVRRIRAVITVNLGRSYTVLDAQTATEASAGLVLGPVQIGGHGGFDAGFTFKSLAALGQVSLDVYADGTPIYTGNLLSATDVQGVRDTIQTTVDSWNLPSTDITKLGNVDAVWLRGYDTLQQELIQPAPYLGDADALNLSISKYATYSGYRWRIATLQDPGRDWGDNKITPKYLKGKAAELDNIMAKLRGYITDLLKKKTTSDPTIGYRFVFQDPEVVRWTLLSNLVRSDGYVLLDFEVVGNVSVTPTTGTEFEVDYLKGFKYLEWGTGQGGQGWYDWSGGQSKDEAWGEFRDKTTGISTRYIRLLLPKGSQKNTVRVWLKTDQDQQWTKAFNGPFINGSTLTPYLEITPDAWN